MLARPPGFDVRVERFCLRAAGSPFRWGETDCATLVRRGLSEGLGREVRADVRGYRSRFGALRAQVETGGVAEVLRGLGAGPRPLAGRMTGDVAIFGRPPDPLVHAALICGRAFLSSSERQGVLLLSRGDVDAPSPAVLRLVKRRA